MDRIPGNYPKFHFHIRWAGVARLDWESFETREKAESCCNKELARPDEIYTIMEFDDTCARCNLKSAAAS